jgi:D-alanyl-lipoteichoic acid acyltransferase DltB (MBOAT superfamily)
VIALNALPFWIACFAAVFVVVPLRSTAARQTVIAGLNLSFLVLLLQWRTVSLLAGIGVAYLLIRLIGQPRWRGVFTGIMLMCMAGLFALHKAPALAARIPAGGIGQILGIVGYSYVALRMVEVLRAVFDERHPAPDLVSLVNYLVPFHMLAAGPIQAYDDFVRAKDIMFEPGPADVLRGMERIAAGLFKKFVLAYFVQKLFLTNLEAGGLYFFVEMQLTLVWLFLDFSAYSDIAVGIGILIGVATPENFNRPLSARNVIDFWERWHISLSQFIRRNVFIPIQMFLMRRGGAPLTSAVAAIGISFLLCGMWHGLTMPYFIWGTLQAGGLMAARLYAFALQKRLGTSGVRQYLQNPVFHVIGIFLTFELQALAVAAVVRA